MKIETLVPHGIKLLSYIAFFIATYIGTDKISQKQYTTGIKDFTFWGLLPLALLAATRHMLFPTTPGDNTARFFEFEAGGVSLAIVVAAILALTLKTKNETFGIIFATYATYLITALFAWIVFQPGSAKKYIYIALFTSVIGILLYFTQVAINKQYNERIDSATGKLLKEL